MKKVTQLELVVAICILITFAFLAKPAHARAFTPCGPYACQQQTFDGRLYEPHILADLNLKVLGKRAMVTLTDFPCPLVQGSRDHLAIFISEIPGSMMKGCWHEGSRSMIYIDWPDGRQTEHGYGQFVLTPYGDQVGF